MGQKPKQNFSKPSEMTFKTKSDQLKAGSTAEAISQHKSHGIRDFLSVLPFLPRFKQKTKSTQQKMAATSQFKLSQNSSLTVNETRMLIRLYQNHDNLYNCQHPAYGDEFYENVCYANIASNFPNKTSRELQSRIHELRMLFEHEYIIIENGYRRFGEIMKPTIKYYNEFLFLLPYLHFNWDSGAYLPPKETCTDDKSEESRASDVSNITLQNDNRSLESGEIPQTQLEFKRSTAGKCFFFKKKDKKKGQKDGSKTSLERQDSKTTMDKVKGNEFKKHASEQANDHHSNVEDEQNKQAAAHKESSVDKLKESDSKKPFSFGKKRSKQENSERLPYQPSNISLHDKPGSHHKQDTTKHPDETHKSHPEAHEEAASNLSRKKSQLSITLEEDYKYTSTHPDASHKSHSEAHGAAASNLNRKRSRLSVTHEEDHRGHSEQLDREAHAHAAAIGNLSRRKSNLSMEHEQSHDHRRPSRQPNSEAPTAATDNHGKRKSLQGISHEQPQDHKRMSRQLDPETRAAATDNHGNRKSLQGISATDNHGNRKSLQGISHEQPQDYKRMSRQLDPEARAAATDNHGSRKSLQGISATDNHGNRKSPKGISHEQPQDHKRMSRQLDPEEDAAALGHTGRRKSQQHTGLEASQSVGSMRRVSVAQIPHEVNTYEFHNEYEHHERPAEVEATAASVTTTSKANYPGNREQLEMLCEMIKMELSESPDFIYYDAKWRIIEVLREVQKRNMMHHKAEPGNSFQMQEQQWQCSRMNNRHTESQQRQCNCQTTVECSTHQVGPTQRIRGPTFSACPYCCKR